MKALANIITTSNRVNFDLPINKCKDMGCRDENIPTLVIGYELAKTLIDGFNILTKRYDNDRIWWTFKKNEKAVVYEKDLNDFYEEVVMKYCEDIKYKYVNFVDLTFKSIMKLVRFIRSDGEKLVFNENNRFLYVYSPKHKIVYGFSLSTADFFGYSPKRILSLLNGNEHVTFLTDFSNIPNKIKLIIGEKIDKYMILNEFFS